MSAIKPSYKVFEFRRDRLFGRESDLQALLERCKKPGFTAITGRPRMGKTWVLEELCRRLEERSFLVGYFECPGGKTDMPLRAIADAYARWLEGASFAEQGRSLWERHKQEAIEWLGVGFGSLVDSIFDLAFSGSLRRNLVKIFRGLKAANKDLKTAGLDLAPLPYEQVRDLAGLLGRMAETPLVVVLDQWEVSDDRKHEVQLIDTYLRELGSWPDVHFFTAVRVKPASEDLIEECERLERSWVAATMYPLGLLDLSSKSEQSRLLSYIRNLLEEATGGAEDAELLELIDGYPGVIDQWTQPGRKEERIVTATGLRQAARNAQHNRYPELEGNLRTLKEENNDELLDSAIRIALVPTLEAEDFRGRVGEIVLDSDDREMTRIHLEERGILSSKASEVPTFGHETRREVALDWAIATLPARTRKHANDLIGKMAREIRDVDDRTTVVAALLLPAIHERAAEVTLSADSEIAYLCCRSLFGIRSREGIERLAELDEATLLEVDFPDLLAMSLVNVVVYAKDENDLGRRDLILQQLWALAEIHPNEPAVRKHLARGLFNVLMDAKDENDLKRRDLLLKQLQTCAKTYPDEPALREALALGLFNVLAHPEDDNDLERSLQQLQTLAEDHPDDTAVREHLAMGLFNVAAHYALEQQSSGEILEQAQIIEDWALRFEEHESLKEPLVRCLDLTLKVACVEKNLERVRDVFSKIVRLKSSDPAIVKQLVVASRTALRLARLVAEQEQDQQLATLVRDEMEARGLKDGDFGPVPRLEARSTGLSNLIAPS